MLISEVARLAGVSPRTIRHYHHLGVVPEPARGSSGYREYGLTDALAVIRAVGLAARGLSLVEVREALRDDTGLELRTILEDVLEDVDQQIAALQARRLGVQEMLLRGDDLRLAHLAAMPPTLAAAVHDMDDAQRAAQERLAWESIASSLPRDDAVRAAAAMEELLADPDQARETADVAAAFAALHEADDVAVVGVARRVLALAHTVPGSGAPPAAGLPIMDAFTATLTPGQQRCLELVQRELP